MKIWIFFVASVLLENTLFIAGQVSPATASISASDSPAITYSSNILTSTTIPITTSNSASQSSSTSYSISAVTSTAVQTTSNSASQSPSTSYATSTVSTTAVPTTTTANPLYWVQTGCLIELSVVVNNTYTANMEAKLAAAYAQGYAKSQISQGRKKRSTSADGTNYLQIVTITRSASTQAYIIYYVQQNQNFVPASTVIANMNFLTIPQLSAILGVPVTSIASYYNSAVQNPAVDQKLWIIGAVLGSLAGAAVIIWLILFVYSKCIVPWDEEVLEEKSSDVESNDYSQTNSRTQLTDAYTNMHSARHNVYEAEKTRSVQSHHRDTLKETEKSTQDIVIRHVVEERRTHKHRNRHRRDSSSSSDVSSWSDTKSSLDENKRKSKKKKKKSVETSSKDKSVAIVSLEESSGEPVKVKKKKSTKKETEKPVETANLSAEYNTQASKASKDETNMNDEVDKTALPGIANDDQMMPEGKIDTDKKVKKEKTKDKKAKKPKVSETIEKTQSTSVEMVPQSSMSGDGIRGTAAVQGPSVLTNIDDQQEVQKKLNQLFAEVPESPAHRINVRPTVDDVKLTNDLDDYESLVPAAFIDQYPVVHVYPKYNDSIVVPDTSLSLISRPDDDKKPQNENPVRTEPNSIKNNLRSVETKPENNSKSSNEKDIELLLSKLRNEMEKKDETDYKNSTNFS